MTTRRGEAWVSPPGDTVEDSLEERGWTQAELAEHLGRSTEEFARLISGSLPLTEDLAESLAKVVGGTTAFWVEREARYRQALRK